MRKQKKSKPDTLTSTVQVCGKGCNHSAPGGCAKSKKFVLPNPQPLGVIRPVEPGNIQVDLPNGKDPADTNKA